MDSKTLNTGIAITLSQSPALAGWKLKGSKLVQKEGPREFTLLLKKLSPRVLDPWQRVGMHVQLILELRDTTLAGMMGLPARTVLVRCHIQSRNQQPWNTTEETPEPLGLELAHRLEGCLPELIRVLKHPAGLESIFRLDVERRRNPGRIKVDLPDGLALVAAQGLRPSATMQPATAFYVATLLRRGAIEEAETFIGEKERNTMTSFLERKQHAVWPALLLHIDGMKAREVQITPLTPADWDFAALDAKLDAQALGEPATKALPDPQLPVDESSALQRILALLSLPHVWETANANPFETVGHFFWQSAVTLLLKSSLTPSEQAQLNASLDRFPAAQRRSVAGLSFEDKAEAWATLRQATLPLSPKRPPHPILVGDVAAKGLSRVVPSECPKLQDLRGHMNSHLELMKLSEALPELRSLTLQAPDTALQAAIKEGALAKIESLRADINNYDRSVKALAKGAPMLKRLSMELVGPAGAKSLGKSKLAPELLALDLSTSDKGWAELVPLWERFSKLEELILRGAALQDTVFPPSLKTLSLSRPRLQGFDFGAQKLSLERFSMDSTGAEALQLAAASASSLKALDVTTSWWGMKADLLAEMAKVDWPELETLHLRVAMFKGNDVAPLVAWLKRMPKLQCVKLRVDVDADGERQILAALSGVSALQIASPHAFNTLGAQSWPALRGLLVHTMHKGTKTPMQDSFAPVLLENMPLLAAFGLRFTPEKLSDAVRAQLVERLVLLT
jgi:hypothetical protein